MQNDSQNNGNDFLFHITPPSKREIVRAGVNHGKVADGFSRCGIVTLAAAELCVCVLNFPRNAIVTVLVLPLPALHFAMDNDFLALAEILADKFSTLPPKYAVKEIGLLLAAAGIGTVNGNGDVADGYAVGRGLCGRVTDKSAFNCDNVH